MAIRANSWLFLPDNDSTPYNDSANADLTEAPKVMRENLRRTIDIHSQMRNYSDRALALLPTIVSEGGMDCIL